MTEKKTSELSRRALLTRIGGLAAAAYTVPAFTTMSMAHASSGSSAASSNSSASSPSEPSEPSEASEASDASKASDASGVSVASGPSDCESMGGTWNGETCDVS